MPRGLYVRSYTGISAFIVCACLHVHTGACMRVPGSMHIFVHVCPLQGRQAHMDSMWCRGLVTCVAVSVLWVLEQSQAGVDTSLSTRSREGMWAPGG